MELNFWTKTSGTWINVFTVLLGSSSGLIFRKHMNKSMHHIIMQGVGLVVLFIGFNLSGELTKVKAGNIEGLVLGLLTIVIGGLLGEYIQIEEKLAFLGDRLKKIFSGGGSFTEGFIVASLLFCLGPMTLIGSLNNGLTGDNTLLLVKATLDGLASFALASSFGIGVIFSIVIILLFQGGISLAAGLLNAIIPDPATDPNVLLITGVGGLMIIGLGINLLDLTKIKVASFIPALVLIPIVYWLASYLSNFFQ